MHNIDGTARTIGILGAAAFLLITTGCRKDNGAPDVKQPASVSSASGLSDHADSDGLAGTRAPDLASPPFQTVAVTEYSFCTVNSSGALACWPQLDWDAAAARATDPPSAPTVVRGLETGVLSISGGGDGTCVITSSRELKCWGYASTDTPTLVNGLGSGVKVVAIGEDFTCAIAASGGLMCWGANRFGQLGDGTEDDRNVPTQVSGLPSGVLGITTGNWHACALTSDRGVKCWGMSMSSKTGPNSPGFDPTKGGWMDTRNVPTPIAGLQSGVVAVSAGRYYTCAVTSAGAVKCWEGYSDVPKQIVGLESGVVDVATGYECTCALTSAGAVKCWGNGEGRCGEVPAVVGGLESGITAISVRRSRLCAVTSTGVVNYW